MSTGISITLAASAIIILYRAFFKNNHGTTDCINIDFDRAKEYELNKR